jgi:hypothetical protein
MSLKMNLNVLSAVEADNIHTNRSLSICQAESLSSTCKVGCQFCYGFLKRVVVN